MNPCSPPEDPNGSNNPQDLVGLPPDSSTGASENLPVPAQEADVSFHAEDALPGLYRLTDEAIGCEIELLRLTHRGAEREDGAEKEEEVWQPG